MRDYFNLTIATVTIDRTLLHKDQGEVSRPTVVAASVRISKGGIFRRNAGQIFECHVYLEREAHLVKEAAAPASVDD